MVTANTAVRMRENTNFTNNYALLDGGVYGTLYRAHSWSSVVFPVVKLPPLVDSHATGNSSGSSWCSWVAPGTDLNRQYGG